MSARSRRARILALALVAALFLAPLPAVAGPAEKQAREGVEFFKKGELDAALDRFGRAAEARPDLPGIQYNLGTTLARQEKFAEAAERLAAAVVSSGAEGAADNDGANGANAAAGGSNAPNAANGANGAPRGRLDPAAARSTRDAFFNLGYAQARASESIPPEKLKERIDALRPALESFRQSIVADPADAEAKYNYETIKRQLRQLEEQKKQQEQQQKGDKGDKGDDSQDGEKQPGDQQEGEQGDSKGDPEKQDGEQKPGEESKPEPKPGDENKPQESEPKPEDGKQGDSQSQADQGEKPEPKDPKQGEGKEKRQDGLEATPTPAPTGAQPPPGSAAQPGEPQPTPLTPEQLDALRVLNGLSEARPEQFQKLFRFRGKKGDPLAKPW